MRLFVRFILRMFYRVEVRGEENFEKAGRRVLIVANHLSFLDAVLLAAFLPEKPLFAINTFIAKQWWIRPFLALADTFSLDPTNPFAAKALIAEMKQDRKCVIFPEGRITVTGSLMKIYQGPGMIADKSGSVILPVRIDGAQYSPFSRLRGKVRIRWFPKITIWIQQPQHFHVPDHIRGSARRAMMGRKLYGVMSEMLFKTSNYQATLFQGFLDARKIHGSGKNIVSDVERVPLSYRALTQRSFIIGSHIAKKTERGEYVGILLPNMAATIAVFFGLQAFGRVPAMLNFSAGLKSILAACRAAKIKRIYTSRRFIKTANLEKLAEGLEGEGYTLVYLEDVRGEIGLWSKIRDMVAGALFPQVYYGMTGPYNPDEAAVVLFTSGTEGLPKGVVLTHMNIQANRYQLSAWVDFGPSDKVFNAMPVFHSFGLTAGMILPLLSGIEVFLYPTPLHYRVVPELVYDTNATIMFGTDTFLAGYARFADPYDFYAVRYIFAGAEKLQEETRRIYAEKYGVRVLEGYGATETAPVLTINTAMQNKPGSVGRLLPGISYRLEEVPGIDEGGRLFVKGPNIMKGYLFADHPGHLVPPEGGWYDTGDIVAFDGEGYIEIKGRAKRFAKIAGEMVSLTAVESLVACAYPDYAHAVVSVPDQKKGEALVLFTEHEKADTAEISKHAQKQGASELMVPRKIKVVDKIPVLGTGKTDYVTLQSMVMEERKKAA